MEIKKIDNLEIRMFADLEELSHHACQIFVSASHNLDIFTVALSGGSTPKRMFELLGTDYKESIFWPKVHIFWGDERAETSNLKSNFQIAFKSWLKYVPANIHPIRPELGLSKAVKDYSQEIDNLASDGFNLAFNGVGADGHRNGIMPDNSKVDWKNDIWDLLESVKVWGSEVPSEVSFFTKRITLTPWFLNKSKINVLMLSGKDKADVLKKITIDKKKYAKRELPALTFNDAPTIILTDKMAASNIFN